MPKGKPKGYIVLTRRKFRLRPQLMRALAACIRQQSRLARKLNFEPDDARTNALNLDMLRLQVTRWKIEQQLRELEEAQNFYVVKYLHWKAPWNEEEDIDAPRSGASQ